MALPPRPPFPLSNSTDEIQPALPAIPYPFARAAVGPIGSHDCYLYNGGFYARIDVPGVNDYPVSRPLSDTDPDAFVDPHPAVLIAMRGRMLHFRASANTTFHASEQRIYEGFIKMNQQVDESVVVTTVSNGVLRIFIPRVLTGTLHFYNRPNFDLVASVFRSPADPPTLHDCLPFIGVMSIVGDNLDIFQQDFPELYPQRVWGVCGPAAVRLKRAEDANWVLGRMDVPDLSDTTPMMKHIHHEAAVILRASLFPPAHPSESSGRQYAFAMAITCGCCKFVETSSVVVVVVINGIMLVAAKYVPK